MSATKVGVTNVADETEVTPFTEADIPVAVRAYMDRENVDHRAAAEALVVFYNTLAEGTKMSPDAAIHLTAVYQQFLLAPDECDEDDD